MGLKVFAICCSSVVIIAATAIALYDSDINDPESLTYFRLGMWQNAFFSFCTTPLLCGLFLPKASDWAILIGFIVGWTTLAVLEIGGWGTEVGTLSFTPFADDPKHIRFKSTIWCFIANVIVAVPLCLIDIGKWLPTPKVLQINSTAYDPEGQPLSHAQIISAMEGTREIIKDPIGIACLILIFVLIFGCIPNFGKSYDGCDFFSYRKWSSGDGSAVDGCEGPNLCGGIPCWVVPILVFFPINKLLITFAYTRWKTIDEDDANSQSKEDEKKGVTI